MHVYLSKIFHKEMQSSIDTLNFELLERRNFELNVKDGYFTVDRLMGCSDFGAKSLN